jgi:hypothetical protein
MYRFVAQASAIFWSRAALYFSRGPLFFRAGLAGRDFIVNELRNSLSSPLSAHHDGDFSEYRNRLIPRTIEWPTPL